MIDIENVAIRFRAAIEEAILTEDFSSDVNMLSFPRGCCGYASDMLQKLLFDQGITTWYISGQYSYGWDAESHVWLETDDGIVIDITGDEYCDREPPIKNCTKVYVGPRDDFHNLFRLDSPVPFSTKRPRYLQAAFEERYKKVMLHFR